jgi:hypothetical protein
MSFPQKATIQQSATTSGRRLESGLIISADRLFSMLCEEENFLGHCPILAGCIKYV